MEQIKVGNAASRKPSARAHASLPHLCCHLKGILGEEETRCPSFVLTPFPSLLWQLLKSEVRRLERNQEREKSAANLEYLKNVLLQFILLKPGSERARLLPVVDTMLQLSPEEKTRLAAAAQGGQGTRRGCAVDQYILCLKGNAGSASWAQHHVCIPSTQEAAQSVQCHLQFLETGLVTLVWVLPMNLVSFCAVLCVMCQTSSFWPSERKTVGTGRPKDRLVCNVDSNLLFHPTGEEESGSRSSGWASYLHSWSGLR